MAFKGFGKGKGNCEYFISVEDNYYAFPHGFKGKGFGKFTKGNDSSKPKFKPPSKCTGSLIINGEDTHICLMTLWNRCSDHKASSLFFSLFMKFVFEPYLRELIDDPEFTSKYTITHLDPETRKMSCREYQHNRPDKNSEFKRYVCDHGLACRFCIGGACQYYHPDREEDIATIIREDYLKPLLIGFLSKRDDLEEFCKKHNIEIPSFIKTIKTKEQLIEEIHTTEVKLEELKTHLAKFDA
jgi:hypothetical protein